MVFSVKILVVGIVSQNPHFPTTPTVGKKTIKNPRLTCINFVQILKISEPWNEPQKLLTSRQHNSDFGKTTSTCQFTEEILHEVL